MTTDFQLVIILFAQFLPVLFWAPETFYLAVFQSVSIYSYAVDTTLDTISVVFTSASIIANYNLVELMSNEKMYPFREATLSDRKGDLKKRWYINFYVFDIQEDNLVRRWDYSVNDYKTAAERYAYAEIRKNQINQLLQKGFHIDRDKTNQEIPETGLTIQQALVFAVNLKTNSKRTVDSYESEVNLFCKYLKSKKKNPIKSLTQKDVYNYIDHLNKQGKAGKTVNSKIGYLKTLCKRLEKRDIIKTNPFADIEREKEVKSTKNVAYTDAEIKLLLPAIKKKNIELYRFVQIIYYTFMRPNEIRQLQVYNIRLSKKQIFVDAYKSKNKKSEYIMIPDGLIDVLIDLVKGKSSQDFLFPGKKFGTPVSKNIMSNKHREIKNQFDLSSDHTLYSWKHTGVVKAFLAGVNIKAIQLQCRHWSISETDNYLKSLGLFDNFEFQMKMPTLLK